MLQVSDTTEAAVFRQNLGTINEELLVTGLRHHEMAEAMERLNSLLEVRANTDGLTGLKNHRTFHTQLGEEADRSLRYNSPLSVLLLDIDHFKQYNDTYGHLAGDSVLRDLANI